MELSPEDSLRLNVLLANKPLAIRIDESKLLVQGLGERGEATVRLQPNARPDQYLRRVRELISGVILGSPGGYPVYLRRWTRMGQMRDESLAQLLQLGEPEAVVAAVSSPGLSDELARLAWWAMEDAGNARRMLKNPAILAGLMGPILAQYLLEYLPFETETDDIVESVSLILQPGLLDPAQRLELWKKSARKPDYLVGFLRALPDELPEPAPSRELPAAIRALAGQGDGCARLLQRLYGRQGQAYLKTAASLLAKPPSQDLVLAVFACLRDYLSPLRPGEVLGADPGLPREALDADAEHFAATAAPDPLAAAVLAREPALRDEVAALRWLSGLGYGLIRPLLPDPTTLGTLMRRKLAPLMEPLAGRLELLRGRSAPR